MINKKNRKFVIDYQASRETKRHQEAIRMKKREKILAEEEKTSNVHKANLHDQNKNVHTNEEMK